MMELVDFNEFYQKAPVKKAAAKRTRRSKAKETAAEDNNSTEATESASEE